VDSVEIEDLKEGNGEEATEGDTVYVQYTGWLENGEQFDSSFDHGEAFQFELGGGNVIEGWDTGVEGMRIGGLRKLTIPPKLGYGNKEAMDGLIPPNSTLVFEIELIGIS